MTEPTRIQQTQEIRGEIVTVSVDLNQTPVDVAVIVRSLGVTWELNERAARDHGVASLWETQVGDTIWIVWTGKRASVDSGPRPWRWFLAPGIFDSGQPLEGETFVPEALVIATQKILASERT